MSDTKIAGVCQIVGSETICIASRGQKYLVPVPYAFTIGAVTIGGVAYLADPLSASFTDGYFIGAVNGSFHLSKDEADVCADGLGGTLRACVRIDVDNKKLYGHLCYRKPFGGWKCDDDQEILSW